jgi:thioredoxin reductase
MNDQSLPVAVIGAGPVGLAAGAHLLARGLTPLILEQGATAGHHVQQWGHVRMFSPWQYVVDAAAVELLERDGWQMPPSQDLPTGAALYAQYLQPLAQRLAPYIQYHARVTDISRRNVDKVKDHERATSPFVIRIEYADGREALVKARAVIDASGTGSQPNPLGANGLPAMGERRHAARLAYGVPDVLGVDRARYAGQRVAVVGSGHSAINALLALIELRDAHPETRVYWVRRGGDMRRIFGGGAADALNARALLGTLAQAAVESGALKILAPFHVRQVNLAPEGRLLLGDGEQTLAVDQVIVATGARPDLAMVRELRLALDPALESVAQLGPMIDPNIHSCGTVPPHGEAELRHPEQDFYIVGMKSYGRAPTFLLLTGYEQVRSVVAALAGDWEAARDVQLILPETGVCSTDDGGGSGGCCVPSSLTLKLGEITIR